MRKIVIWTSALLLSACTNVIEYDFVGVEPQLVVTGILKANEKEHTVYMSVSRNGRIEALKEGTVKCYVNDVQVAEESGEFAGGDMYDYMLEYENKPEGWWHAGGDFDTPNQLILKFSADFVPGDNVKLEFEADGGKYKASTPVLSVPEPVSFSKVDTSRVMMSKLDEMDKEYFRFTADLPDRKNENNWYCVEALKQCTGLMHFADDGPDRGPFETKSVMHMDKIDDLVLLDGNTPGNDLISFGSTGQGDFAVFSDALFKNETAHLRMNYLAEDYFFYSPYSDNFYLMLDHYYPGELGRDRKSLHMTVSFSLLVSNCSEATYHYLRALRTITSESYTPQIMEPVTVPSNLNGGIGFVDIVNTTYCTFDFPDEDVDYNWY